MTRINSIAQIPNSDSFFACGHYWANEATTAVNVDVTTYNTQGVILKVKNDGTVIFYMQISGTNPVSSKVSQDECWGLSTNKDGSFAATLSIKMSEVRSTNKGDFKDVLLITFDNMGALQNSVVFSLGTIN